jgi:hypothetical protein
VTIVLKVFLVYRLELSRPTPWRHYRRVTSPHCLVAALKYKEATQTLQDIGNSPSELGAHSPDLLLQFFVVLLRFLVIYWFFLFFCINGLFSTNAPLHLFKKVKSTDELHFVFHIVTLFIDMGDIELKAGGRALCCGQSQSFETDIFCHYDLQFRMVHGLIGLNCEKNNCL